jgi:hypothetical protein
MYTSGASTGSNSFINSNSSALTISENTNIYFNLNNQTVVTISTIGSTYQLNVTGNVQATSYNATSDRRLKSNIRNIDPQWENIKRVIPSEYEWKSNGLTDHGFIAQQLYDVYPNLRKDYSKIIDPNSSLDEPVDVSGNPIYYSIDYGKMTPYLWKGMQEMMEVIDQQSLEIDSLKSQLASVNSQLASIQRILGIT